MPGAVEGAAKVASTTIDALKQTPIVLALVLFNIVFMLTMIYISVKSSARWDEELGRMHDLVAKAMASCGPK